MQQMELQTLGNVTSSNLCNSTSCYSFEDFLGGTSYWDRTGTVLSPSTAGDDITTTGTGTFGSGIYLGTETGIPWIYGDNPNDGAYSRVHIKPKTGNKQMQVFLYPSGTATTSAIQVRNSADDANTGRQLIGISGATAYMKTDNKGAGTLPTNFILVRVIVVQD